jgi:hypothetical protein
MVLSDGVPEHPCLGRFEQFVKFVGSAKSGNIINDVHRIIDQVKKQAETTPGVYDVKKMRALLGQQHISTLNTTVDMLHLVEDLKVVGRMPKPPPVKEFYSRFDPEGTLRDLGTGNGAKADDSGLPTVGYEDHVEKAPDVQMEVKSVSEYRLDHQEGDVTSSFLSYSSSYNNFEVKGDALHVYPDTDYMLECGLATARDDGLYESTSSNGKVYIDKDVGGGEAIAPGYCAKLELQEREVTYKADAYTCTLEAHHSIGHRIVSNVTWMEMEKRALVSYKYDGRRVVFRQMGKTAYLIDGEYVLRFRADKTLSMEVDMELLGEELIVTKVWLVGPIRPYDTYQAIEEFVKKITLNIPGFYLTAPELFGQGTYEKYLRTGRVDGKIFRYHAGQYLLKHHMSLDFRCPVSAEEIKGGLTREGFTMSRFEPGPGSGVEEYEFKRNANDSSVEVVYKRTRELNKRTDTYQEISQINWPTTEKRPAGLEAQPRFHKDCDIDGNIEMVQA